MIGIYLLVSIFVQLSPLTTQMTTQIANGFGWNNPVEPVELAIAFDELNGVRIGTPVVLDGRQVGRVTSIQLPDEANPGYQVSVEVSSQLGGTLNSNTIGLQALPMSASRAKPEMVVELLSMPGTSGAKVAGGEVLTGFSSLEKFWRGSSSRRA